MGMNLAVKTFYREILLSILAVLLGFFLVLVTMDGLEEMKNLGEHDYTWRTLISVVLLRSPDYVYRLLPICTLIGGVLALSNMAARPLIRIGNTCLTDQNHHHRQHRAHTHDDANHVSDAQTRGTPRDQLRARSHV